MFQLNTYLTFNGNCREAMTFYQQCLGGELLLQTVAESPVADKVPAQMAQSILHSSLNKDGWMLMGSDMCRTELIRGNAITMCINCNSEDEINNLYRKLSVGGEATHPLEHTFWGALFGELTDKFGNNWMLNYQST